MNFYFFLFCFFYYYFAIFCLNCFIFAVDFVLSMNYEEFLDATASGISRFWCKHKVGILATLVFHLLLLVVLLSFKLHYGTEYYGSEIAVEFDEEVAVDEVEEAQAQLLPADAVESDYEVQAIRNFAVDASDQDLNAQLPDEKNIDAAKLYEDAERLKQEMLDNQQFYDDLQDDEAIIPNTPKKEVPESAKAQISGPTVVSYYLKDRKARRLPIPAYKCERGGQVVVIIEVLPNGQVSGAAIDKKLSVIDHCINQAAIKAAHNSWFTAADAKTKQKGSITYLFVPQ